MENGKQIEKSLGEVTVVETTALEIINKSEIDIQISTAKRFKRSIEKFRKNVISMATQDVETAMSCFYQLPRGGKTIEGPSVRLAEMAMNQFGNCRAGFRTIAVEQSKVITEGFFWDLENNVAIKVENHRKITNKDGERFSEDMITTTTNASGAIAFRNAIFKGMAGQLKSLQYKIKSVAVGDKSTMNDRKKTMFDKFEGLGVSKQQLLDKLEKEGEADINLTDVEALIGIYTAIQEEDTTVDEQFVDPDETISEPQSKTGKDKPENKKSQLKVDFDDLLTILEQKSKKVKDSWKDIYEKYLNENSVEPMFLEINHYEDLIPMLKAIVKGLKK